MFLRVVREHTEMGVQHNESHGDRLRDPARPPRLVPATKLSKKKGVSCNAEKGKEDAHERYTKSHAKESNSLALLRIIMEQARLRDIKESAEK
jgi:hypothetical protein